MKTPCYLKQLENDNWIIVSQSGKVLSKEFPFRIEAKAYAINNKLNLKGLLS